MVVVAFREAAKRIAVDVWDKPLRGGETFLHRRSRFGPIERIVAVDRFVGLAHYHRHGARVPFPQVILPRDSWAVGCLRPGLVNHILKAAPGDLSAFESYTPSVNADSGR